MRNSLQVGLVSCSQASTGDVDDDGMARRRLIIHGSQEELDMFEPIYNTRLRLQHGASSSRFQLPDPPPSAESENEDDDEGTASNVQSVDREGNGAAVETCIWRRSGDEENHDSLTDEPHSTTLTEERVGSANNGSTGLEGT